ncbi:DUF1330 domain-containing protein [Niveispirillum cyanobacteriorum]|uniref:DUF1330 domain-containing protein n=1 Tax=Niveispirillum cyanobacteriorum TaxID=1612173 RepID=A0A2K9NDH0_9PROT|nr:DUF1330 domain-containing protein [Niveispirillum cyanobacteriorum]AUN31191.1 DUF1330 domain-containing protein [Niveispirillum cyanobacteriorum]GGE86538.1 hypothetical protein GCM10011317_49640 [Niveispirillum cyanobacteriorum]
MPAYMIITARIHDRDAFIAGYGKAAAELVTRYGGEYVFRGRNATLLEGDFGDGAAILVSRWPDMPTLRRFWDSDDYAAVKRLRDGMADIQVVAVEGEWQG